MSVMFKPSRRRRQARVINGGTFAVPAALGNKIIHPYSDFLLHDIKTGDGIVQAGPQDTANKLRTAPLWGLRMRPRFMHDLQSLTLENAIERHKGEAEDVRGALLRSDRSPEAAALHLSQFSLR